jgi:hypothetical protein
MEHHNYIGLAYQFWNLVIESINEMEKLENKSLIISKKDLSLSEKVSWKKYKEQTKWNDFNIGVPVLFNYYHGLELFMKGLLQEIGKLPDKNNHNLTDYHKVIKENEIEFTEELVDLVNIYIGDKNPYKKFFKENFGSVNQFYLMLRYPTTIKKNKTYRYKEIRGTDKKGLDKWLKLRDSTISMKTAIENWKGNSS